MTHLLDILIHVHIINVPQPSSGHTNWDDFIICFASEPFLINVKFYYFTNLALRKNASNNLVNKMVLP